MSATLIHLLAVSDLLTAAESAASVRTLRARQREALVRAIANAKRAFNTGESEGGDLNQDQLD